MVKPKIASEIVFGGKRPRGTGAGTRVLLLDGGVSLPTAFGGRLTNMSIEQVQRDPGASADQHAYRGAVLCGDDSALGIAPGATLVSGAYQTIFPAGYSAFVQRVVAEHGPIDVTAHAYSAAPTRALVLAGAAEQSHLVSAPVAEASTVLAAAGHTGADGVRFPALSRSVLAIGVAGADGRPTSYCSVSPEQRKPELLVPDGAYATRAEGGEDASLGGTSAAVNIAAGVASLWYEELRRRGLTPCSSLVRAALLAASEPTPSAAHRALSSRGLVGDEQELAASYRRLTASERSSSRLRVAATGKLALCAVADQVEENDGFEDAAATVHLRVQHGERILVEEQSTWARVELDVVEGDIVELDLEVTGRAQGVAVVALGAAFSGVRAPAVVRRGRIVLGIGASHDAGACLMRNGVIERAVQLERLTRIKHDGKPMLGSRQAIDYCLRSLGVRESDVDLFCFNLQSVVPGYAGLSQPVAARGFDAFDPFSERAVFVSHHLAHAFAVFHSSPFARALVLVADGSGGSTLGKPDLLLPGPAFRRYLEEGCASRPGLHVQSGYVFDPDGYRLLSREEAPSFNTRTGSSSLGEAYAAVTQYVFGDWQASGKLMGLAPYGAAEEFGPSVLERDAAGRLNFGANWKLSLDDLSKKEDPMPLRHLAARIQTDFETALLERVKALLEASGEQRLAYSGGLALNSVANERIAQLVGASNLYVMPASSDAGIAVGAAAAGDFFLTQGTRHAGTAHDFHGHPYTERDYKLALEEVSAAVEVQPRRLEQLADALLAGNVVGWFDAGSELGPRALGHRSILADPRSKDMWLHINRRIKFREDFRPFAPMVPRELASEYFELDGESPYMLRVVRVRPKYQKLLGAVTHVDGSARVQTVDERVLPKIHELLLAFGQRSGVAVLLNTSMNVRGEPVVETPSEALEMLLCTHLDAVVLGDHVVRRRSGAVAADSRICLAPKTHVRSVSARGTPRYELCAEARGNKVYPLDSATYQVLAHAGANGTVESLRQRHAATADPERLLSKLNALGTLGLTLTLAPQPAPAAEMSEAPRPSAWSLSELLTPADHQALPVSCVARCARLEDTWTKVSALRTALGITRVADLTDYDRVGIPVVGATRPSVDSLQITATQGKGMDLLQARVSALMEAVERHAAAQARPSLTASVNELRARKERWVEAHALGVEFSDAAPIEWLSARSLKSGQTAWIPAAEVLFPYRAPARVLRPVRPSTTGLSSGNTAAEAVLHALCEVAERAAVSRYLETHQAPLVDLSRLPDGVERELVRRFEEAEVELAVYDLSGLGPLPTYLVSTVSPDNLGAPVVTAGQGTSQDARLALRRALLEAAQSRVVALQGSREDLVRHASSWTSDGAAACRLWEETRATAMSHGIVAPPAASPSSTVAEALAQVLAALARHGHTEAFITDLTHPKIGLPVVHACVPGLNDWVVDATRGRHVG